MQIKFRAVTLALLIPLAFAAPSYAEHGEQSGHERPRAGKPQPAKPKTPSTRQSTTRSKPTKPGEQERYSLPGKIKPKELKGTIRQKDGAYSIITGQKRDKKGRIEGDHSHSVVKNGKVVFSRTQGGTVVHDAGETKKSAKPGGGKQARPNPKNPKQSGSGKPAQPKPAPKSEPKPGPKPSGPSKAMQQKVHDEHPAGTNQRQRPDWRRAPVPHAPQPSPSRKGVPPRPSTMPIAHRPVHDEHPSGLNLRTGPAQRPTTPPQNQSTWTPRPGIKLIQPPAPQPPGIKLIQPPAPQPKAPLLGPQTGGTRPAGKPGWGNGVRPGLQPNGGSGMPLVMMKH